MIRMPVTLLSLLLLTACGTRDSRPLPDGAGRPLDPNRIEVPQPRPELRARYGNHSPYSVLGRTYHVLPSARGYRERGIASWYGSKFHGRLTSSGESFDMYKVSAAHKTLPLPSWVEVTNLDNDRRLVLRINDRGPFKEGRIIDLSYAAAVKLGVLDSGTAAVEVRALEFGDLDNTLAHVPAALPVELQAGAFAKRETAERLAGQLRDNHFDRVRIERIRTARGPLWRVRIGPVRDADQASRLFERLLALGLGPPVYIYP